MCGETTSAPVSYLVAVHARFQRRASQIWEYMPHAQPFASARERLKGSRGKDKGRVGLIGRLGYKEKVALAAKSGSVRCANGNGAGPAPSDSTMLHSQPAGSALAPIGRAASSVGTPSVHMHRLYSFLSSGNAGRRTKSAVGSCSSTRHARRPRRGQGMASVEAMARCNSSLVARPGHTVNKNERMLAAKHPKEEASGGELSPAVSGKTRRITDETVKNTKTRCSHSPMLRRTR